MPRKVARRRSSPSPPASPPESPPPWLVKTLDQVAAFFDRERETLKDWRRKGMPGTTGAYDLKEILAWKDANIGASGRPEETDQSRAEADRRRAWADARRAEVELSKALDQVIEVDDAVREYQRAASTARALFEQFPDRLLQFLPPSATGPDKRHFRDQADRAVQDVIAAMHVSLLNRAAAMEAAADDASPPGPPPGDAYLPDGVDPPCSLGKLSDPPSDDSAAPPKRTRSKKAAPSQKTKQKPSARRRGAKKKPGPGAAGAGESGP